MKDEDTKEIHFSQHISSFKIMEIMDKYPNLEIITCPPSIYKRISKTYIEVLNTLDINVKTKYKRKRKPKKSNIILKDKIMKLAKEGYAPKQIAKKLDISLNKVYNINHRIDEKFKFNNYKRKYTDEDRNLIISMKNNGESPKNISEKLNIPVRSVYYILNKK